MTHVTKANMTAQLLEDDINSGRHYPPCHGNSSQTVGKANISQSTLFLCLYSYNNKNINLKHFMGTSLHSTTVQHKKRKTFMGRESFYSIIGKWSQYKHRLPDMFWRQG